MSIQSHVAASFLAPAHGVNYRSRQVSFKTLIDALPLSPLHATVAGLEPVEDLEIEASWYNSGDAAPLLEETVAMMAGSLTVKDGKDSRRPELSLRASVISP